MQSQTFLRPCDEPAGFLAGNAGIVNDQQRSLLANIEGRLSFSAAVEILDELRSALERNPEAVRVAALQLVKLLSEPIASDQPYLRGGLAPWQRRAVVKYMQQQIESPLRLRELADQASLSVSYFCRAFKESFGMTPHQYLTRLRLERAQQLMLTTLEPLSQIALACGMADQAHLSKLFRRMVGEPPSVWRRRNSTGAYAST